MMILKRSVQFILLILLAVSFRFGWEALQRGEIFPIAVVKVEAEYHYLSPKELPQAISRVIFGDASSNDSASFLTVDTRSLKSQLQDIAWIQSVDVQKIWPETLKIRINEKKVMAQWGKEGLLSDKEEIF